MESSQRPPPNGQTHTVNVSGHALTLSLIPLNPNLAIALLMIIDQPISFSTHIGQHLASILSDLKPDIIVAPATLGIPVAIEVSRALGLERYVILQKSPKVHLGDALEVRMQSITSKGEQRLLLDRKAVPLLEGRRVVVVDDVVASGASLAAALKLVRQAGAEVVGVGAILTEGWQWKREMGMDSGMVRALSHIPQFEKGEDGSWRPIEGT